MTPIRISALIVFSCLLLTAQPASPVPSTDDVVLDLVVKDKKGKPLRDLKAGEIEITDNGEKVKPSSLRLIDGTSSVLDGTPAPLDPVRQTRLITLVFEQLNEDARRLAKQAANDLIKAENAPNVYFSVVGINQQLILLQPFTTDRALLKKALDEATSGNQLVRLADRSEAARKALTGLPASATDVEKKLAQVMLDMTREKMSATDGTRATLFALLSMVRGLGSMPGRKAIMYVSTGLYLPTYLDEPFRSVISTANRANVSVYALDARGVMTGRQNEEIASAMKSVASDTAADVTASDGAVSTRQILASDRVESAMRNNVQLALRDLAESTGAFLIAETNSFGKPMQQLADEVNTYYEVTYNPGITNYDGSFRKTDVKINRGDAKLTARNGYFALPADIRASGLMPFEAVLIKALQSAPLPREVPFRSSAIRFHSGAEGTHEEIIIEVPMSNLSFREDTAANLYHARVSVIAVLRNAKGEIVQKLSRDLPLQGPIAQAAQVKQGNFIYKEHFTIPPGRYTLETAAIDSEANKIGAKKATLVVAPKAAGVSMSNITLVRRFQPKAASMNPDEDFQFQGGLITPTLGTTVVAAKGAMLSLFFVVYPDPAIAEKPQAVIEYIKDGKVVGRGEVELPPADASGRIPYVMSSSAEAMPPGEYEIRAVVKQGTTTSEDRAFVTIEAPAAGSGS